MFSALWGRITGADKEKALPDQQASVLGRLGDYIIIYPYGMYCDLPNDVWLNILGKGQAIPMTSSRPDSARGEPVYFHPVTGAKVHFKNNGDIQSKTTNGEFLQKEDGSIKGSNSAGSFELQAGGNFVINGVTIDPSGNITTNGTINADDVTADNQNVTLSTHGHPALNTAPNPGT